MGVISKMTFDNGSTKNLIGSTFYGKCDTAAATAAKTVTIGGWDESVKDNVSGATVHIYFENGNSASNPTLNIDSQGAHRIITTGDASVAAFPAGIYSFTLVPSNVAGDTTYRWMMEAAAVTAKSADFATSAGTATSAGSAGTASSADSVPWSGVTNKPYPESAPSTNGKYNLNVNGSAVTWVADTPGSDVPNKPSDTGSYVLNVGSSSAEWDLVPDLPGSSDADGDYVIKKETDGSGYSLSWEKATTTDTTYTLTTGDSNGQIKVTPSVGNAYNVDVKGLGSNAYTSTAYLPKTGGDVTGDIVLLKQVSSGAPGDSYGITFQRGTLTDNYNDWRILDSGGYLHFYERGSGSTSWNDRVVFNTTGNVSATSFTGSGASLTSLNASNLSSGTVPIARLPDLSSTYIPVSQKGAASGVAELDSNSKLPVVQSNYLYGKCSTAAGTAAKTVSIPGYSETTIAAMEGVTVFVAFAYSNTAASPTLNVSGSGAHPIVAGTYQDPANVGRFSNGLHSFTLVKASDNNYYWWINEGRDTVPEAPTSAGTYLLTINSSGNVSWSSYTPPTAATTGTVTISASGWSGNGPYSHSVTISGTTANSKIDLQPDSTVLAQMTTDGTTALYIENNNGTLTAWAMGAAPTASLTIQYTKTEVG